MEWVGSHSFYSGRRNDAERKKRKGAFTVFCQELKIETKSRRGRQSQSRHPLIYLPHTRLCSPTYPVIHFLSTMLDIQLVQTSYYDATYSWLWTQRKDLRLQLSNTFSNDSLYNLFLASKFLLSITTHSLKSSILFTVRGSMDRFRPQWRIFTFFHDAVRLAASHEDGSALLLLLIVLEE